jgi:hypothetical protein
MEGRAKGEQEGNRGDPLTEGGEGTKIPFHTIAEKYEFNV